MNNRFTAFVGALQGAVASGKDEPAVVESVVAAMARLVAADDWLAEEFTQPHPTYYRQYLLHRDPQDRFSVVSFVWGPGQATPIHDHMTWGVIGMLRGSEQSQAYRRTPEGAVVPHGEPETLVPGQVVSFSPRIGDIHKVSNALADRVSISIHAYGADIGKQKRHVFDPATGAMKEFVSGYSNVEANA